ncbi:hypothetical protein F511_28468 [Dorcoceras hygrometricum]|uniref:Uncharacterized protein n=1 Tax=Dorcoceras hygrometricum TaxID=472368 RepID=A0A2Z7D6F4_9LAMI|nr:hypothetical protein F511_28468 [Dorcoceras hygrometricum]
MVVDSIGIYEFKGPYYTLNMTEWFLQAPSVIPRGSWSDISRRFTMCTPTKELEKWSVDRIRSNQRSAIYIGEVVVARRIVTREVCDLSWSVCAGLSGVSCATVARAVLEIIS